MTNPPDREAIVRFVRDTLGCGCPDEVFNSIVIARAGGPGSSTPHVRLLVGNRLLIYVLDGLAAEHDPAVVPSLAARGRDERDRDGLNRFRLVIFSQQGQRPMPAASASFAEATGPDERANLHLVAAELIPADLR